MKLGERNAPCRDLCVHTREENLWRGGASERRPRAGGGFRRKKMRQLKKKMEHSLLRAQESVLAGSQAAARDRKRWRWPLSILLAFFAQFRRAARSVIIRLSPLSR